MAIDDETLDKLEQLHEAATPGPWKNDANNRRIVHNRRSVYWVRGATMEPCSQIARAERVADANLITAARNALPDLIAEVRRLRDELASCGLCGRVTDESCVICEACEDEPLGLLRLVRSQRDAARRRARAWKALAKRLWSERRGERQMRLRAEAQKSMRMTLEEHHEAITEARADERRRVCEEIEEYLGQRIAALPRDDSSTPHGRFLIGAKDAYCHARAMTRRVREGSDE